MTHSWRNYKTKLILHKLTLHIIHLLLYIPLSFFLLYFQDPKQYQKLHMPLQSKVGRWQAIHKPPHLPKVNKVKVKIHIYKSFHIDTILHTESFSLWLKPSKKGAKSQYWASSLQVDSFGFFLGRFEPKWKTIWD